MEKENERGKSERSGIEDRSSRNGVAAATVINLKGSRVINEWISRDWFGEAGTDVSMAQIRPRKQRRFIYTRYAVQHGETGSSRHLRDLTRRSFVAMEFADGTADGANV